MIVGPVPAYGSGMSPFQQFQTQTQTLSSQEAVNVVVAYKHLDPHKKSRANWEAAAQPAQQTIEQPAQHPEGTPSRVPPKSKLVFLLAEAQFDPNMHWGIND